MKKITLAALFSIAGYLVTSAQCDKKFNLTIDKVFQLQPDSTEGDIVSEAAQIVLSKDSIHVTVTMPDGSSMVLKGLNKETVCRMNPDYSNGTIELVYDAVLFVKGNSKTDRILFTVISENGAMKLIGAPESNRSDKLCFVVKNKEEVK
jgi:hypothetical protein